VSGDSAATMSSMSDASCGVPIKSKMEVDDVVSKLQALVQQQQQQIEVLMKKKGPTKKTATAKNESEEKEEEDDDILSMPQGRPKNTSRPALSKQSRDEGGASPPKKKKRNSPDGTAAKRKLNQDDKPDATAPVPKEPSQDKILEHRVKEDGTVECYVVMFDGGKAWLSRERTYSLWFEEIEKYVNDWNESHKGKEKLKKGWRAASESRAKIVVEVARITRDTTEETVDGVTKMVEGQWAHVIYENGYACWSKVAAVHDEWGDLFAKFMEDAGMTWDETLQEAVKN
jgi:hypothetical protein